MSRARRALVLTLLAAGCTPPTLPITFEDHTLPKVDSLEQFESLAVIDHGRASTKFVLTGFDSDAPATVYFDAHFYQLHDEWYWFRLLNGASVPGNSNFAPVSGLEFDSIKNIYDWAATQDRLPFDLQWVDGHRLYSPRFYDLSIFHEPRTMAAGTLLHVTASGQHLERWAFMLEFVDAASHEEVVRIFDAVKKTLPPGVGEQLFWVVRSAAQESLAKQMETNQLQYFDRILRLEELTAVGETEVYSGGLTAGRLRAIRTGESLDTALASDILLLQEVPDFLPPAAGVVTAVPQTPLAHFNLLARNRGIPNAYRGGVLDDSELDDLAFYRSPVVISASVPDQLVIKQISELQLSTWLSLLQKSPVSVTQIDWSMLPYTYNLATLSFADVDSLRPAVGGKAAGYLGLIAGAPGATPDTVMAISIRAYLEHLAPLKSRLAQMLAAGSFVDQSRARYLALEGAERYAESHASADDVAFAASFMTTHPAGDVLGDLARAGGLKDVIRAMPIAPATIAAISASVGAGFAHYAHSQGLRFRSSSTAEDVEGFNGAGLYDSNTGFLDPSAAADPDERKQSLEWAIKKTWASYWSAEAFEERRLENIDHLSGSMGVVVHARFDDDKEKSNGVFVFTLQRDRSSMELNVQTGALSVTNPSSTQLPEIDRVSLAPGATQPRIERLRPSTVVPAGTVVLTDEELLQTFARGLSVATGWLQQSNSSRPEAQKASTVVLDFEFRQVPQGWPALASGAPFPARVVLKQTRSLEPSSRELALEVRSMPIPKDVLGRSRKLERRICENEAVSMTLVEVYTDPLLAPDLGYSVAPFTASVIVQFKQAAAAVGRAAGETVTLDHLGFAEVTHPGLSETSWAVSISTTSSTSSAEHLSAIAIHADGKFELTGAGTFSGTGMSCRTQALHSTPNEYLLGLLQ